MIIRVTSCDKKGCPFYVETDWCNLSEGHPSTEGCPLVLDDARVLLIDKFKQNWKKMLHQEPNIKEIK